jgi:integral membrane protein
MSRIGRWWAISAFVEALSWTGLLVGMFLKYVTDTTEAGVQFFGPIHGVAFLVYVALTLAAAARLRWGWRIAALALAASIPPLVTIAMERWLQRRGRLAA